MVSCFIVGDASTVEVLSGYMKSLPLTLKGYTSSFIESISDIQFSKPDLVYIDIKFLKRYPIEFNLLRQICLFVILSDRMEEAYEAFEYQAFDYLLKPVTYGRFIKGIEKYQVIMMRSFGNTHSQLIAPQEAFYIKVDANGLKEIRVRYTDLLFIED